MGISLLFFFARCRSAATVWRHVWLMTLFGAQEKLGERFVLILATEQMYLHKRARVCVITTIYAQKLDIKLNRIAAMWTLRRSNTWILIIRNKNSFRWKLDKGNFPLIHLAVFVWFFVRCLVSLSCVIFGNDEEAPRAYRSNSTIMPFKHNKELAVYHLNTDDDFFSFALIYSILGFI